MHVNILLSNLVKYSHNPIVGMRALNWLNPLKLYVQSMAAGQSGSVKKADTFKKLLRQLCHQMIPLVTEN